jgi:hypothetical protein
MIKAVCEVGPNGRSCDGSEGGVVFGTINFEQVGPKQINILQARWNYAGMTFRMEMDPASSPIV